MGKIDQIQPARPKFPTEAQLKRLAKFALDTAKEAGITVNRCEIHPDGRIVLSEESKPQESALSAWKKGRENRA
jgi:hypothetical protein